MLPPPCSLAVILAGVSLGSFTLGWFCRSPGGPPPAVAGHAPPPASRPMAAVLAAPAFDAPGAFDAAAVAPATDYRRRLRLAAAAAGLDRAGVIEALEREQARGAIEYSDRIPPTEALLARFAELDPPGAVAWLVQSYPGAKIAGAWQDVTLSAWVAQDRQAAVAWVNGLPRGSLRDDFTFALLEKLALIDPALTIQQCAALRGDFHFSLSNVFATLATRDLAAAREQALQLSPDNTAGAIRGVMQFWAARQPAEAYAWAARLPPGTLRDGAVRQVYETWVEQSPAAAAAWLSAHAEVNAQQNVSDVASAWAERDLAAARAWSDGLTGRARQEARSKVVGVWTKSDPRGAAEYAAALPTAEHANLLSDAVERWARANQPAALAWAENSAPAAVRGEALRDVCYGWSQEDPGACVAYLLEHPEEKALGEAMFNATSNWSEQDPAGMWRWSQGLTDPETRGGLGTQALEGLAASDPAQAIGLLGRLPSDSQPIASRMIGEQWAKVDPAAAARWAATLPADATQKGVWRSVVTTWAGIDAPGAAAWLDTRPAGESRDESISALVGTFNVGLSPAVAVHLAQSVQSPETRSAALTQAATAWLGQDRPAATAWIEQSPDLTPEIRHQLLGSASRAGFLRDPADQD